MSGERFFEVRARFDTLDGALKVAHTLNDSGVHNVTIDNGEGYGMRECIANGCDSILYYPDEGNTCYDHR